MTTPSPLATAGFWRLLAERLGRQAAQTAVPILATLVAAGGQVDVKTVGIALAGSLGVTVVKSAFLYLADFEVPADAPFVWQLVDRAVPAAFGVLAGLWPVSADGLLNFQWQPALYAAGAAAVTAILSVYVTPPAFAHRLAA